MARPLLVAMLLLAAAPAAAALSAAASPRPLRHALLLSPAARLPTPLAAARGKPAAGKGFGKKAAAPPPSSPAAVESALEQAPSASSREQSLTDAEARGRLALEKMRQESGKMAVKPKRASPALTPEELEPVDPSAGVMPQVVSDRMLRRVVPFAGLPIFGGMAAFIAFYYANTQLGLDLPPQIVAYSTQVFVLLSFAGITWGVMSTSWDEEIEGSLLGLEQVGKNFNLMRGVDIQKREEARIEFAEADAAKDGVIMNRAQLAKQQKRNSKK